MSKKDPYASEAETQALLVPDTRTAAERKLDQIMAERGADEQGAEAYLILRQIAVDLLAEQPAPVQTAYKDSTPHLSVGESSFESWFGVYGLNLQCVSSKQMARDAYAAGMGDPLVTAVPVQQEPNDRVDLVIEKIKAGIREKPTALNSYGLKLWETVRDDLLALAAEQPAQRKPLTDAQPVSNADELPNGFVPLQKQNGKLVYSACMDSEARHYKWLMWRHPDGQWVSKRKLEDWEAMQVEDQQHYGIVQEAAHGFKEQP